ncbi:MAG: DUF169 domain-containing protein [Methanoregulaceae archaeon]|jgi:hypothetical protein|nr:DUF169 domain-containing protein [Methanoregulaceae archaeon]MCU0628349.1 DUF169 domain-containing protein [Methanoregulaceae archaeon]
MDSVRVVGKEIATACRLSTEPLAVYGSDSVPEGAVHLHEVHRCIAAAMVKMATERGVSAFYLGSDAKTGCCPGGLSHTGYITRPPAISFFVSTGRPGIPDAPAEYLKASPGLVDQCFDAEGKITPLGKYLVVRTCASVPDSVKGVKAISCFGNAEQIRNLSALVHFDRADPFSPVLVPWGPACATVVTYPAGMAEHAPAESAFLGPQDPTVNWALSPDLMAIGLPIGVARRIAENLNESFIAKRPSVAFPDHGKGFGEKE